MCLKCPSSTLHDDIERRTSSRAHQSRAQFLTAALPFTKEKQQKPRCFGIPAAKVCTIVKAIYSA